MTLNREVSDSETDLNPGEIFKTHAETVRARRAIRRRKRVHKIKIVFLQVLGVGAVLGIWQFLGSSGVIDPLFVGLPSKIFDRLLAQLADSNTWMAAYSTIGGLLLGWVLAAIIAIAFAFLITRSTTLRSTTEPITTALNGLPRIAFAPIFVLWFGIGVEAKIAMSFSVAFFVILSNTLAAIDGVDSDQKLLAKVIGASDKQTFRKFILPGAIPTIFAGLELAVVFALLGVVGGELLAGSQGLGVKLALYGAQFQTNDYFATLTILGVISLIITQLLRLLRHRLLRWKDSEVGATID